MKVEECRTTDLTKPVRWVAYIRGVAVGHGTTLDEARRAGVEAGYPVDALVYRAERGD